MDKNKENNLKIWNAVKSVPNEAKRDIAGGKIKGFTDINPIWRLQALTENFGICGFGWKYEIVKLWLEPGPADNVSAFAQINLFVKVGDTWSDPIPGIGGNNFISKGSQSDECYKMALTDAISVACKALGIGADVYWERRETKYSQEAKPVAKPATKPVAKKPLKIEDALSEKMMSFLAKKQAEANAQKKNFVPAVWLKDNYNVSDQDLKKIIAQYELKTKAK